jgi:hypothetical protein
MVPHSLFATSDRQFDLALNLLTMIVSGAIAVSVIYFAITLMAPKSPPDRGDVGPPRWAAMPEILIEPWQLDFDAELPPLSGTGTVYRCDRNGRVTYSDRPCIDGRVRLLPSA